MKKKRLPFRFSDEHGNFRPILTLKEYLTTLKLVWFNPLDPRFSVDILIPDDPPFTLFEIISVYGTGGNESTHGEPEFFVFSSTRELFDCSDKVGCESFDTRTGRERVEVEFIFYVD